MSAIEEIPLKKIDIGRNVRDDVGDLSELAANIAELGVLQPVKVTPNGSGRFGLVFGQRRVLAARKAGLTTIPAMVVAPEAKLAGRGARRAAEQLAENVQRKSLNPIEKANALLEVLEANPDLTQAALATQLGRTPAWLSNILRILDLEPSVQELLRRDEIAEATARTLLPLSPKSQAKIARRAVGEGWSRRTAEREVQRALNPPAKRPARGRPPIIELPLPNERSRSISIPVRGPNGIGVVSIGVDGSNYVDLVVEDADGHRVMLALKAADARLIGRRLEQAHRAIVA